MKLLLVEDDFDLSGVLSRSLSSRGFELLCCADGIEALAAARKKRFDVIVLDLSLPGLDGLELLQRLRGDGNLTPVLVLTAHRRPECRRRRLPGQALRPGRADRATRRPDAPARARRRTALRPAALRGGIERLLPRPESARSLAARGRAPEEPDVARRSRRFQGGAAQGGLR
jgi:CheY-like chemotaxis protein